MACVIMFGAGIRMRTYLFLRKEFPEKYSDDEILLVDNDKSKHGSMLGDFKVHHPDIISRTKFDCIVIAVKYGVNEIRNQLIERFDIQMNCIYTMEEYKIKKNIAFQYKKYRENLRIHRYQKFNPTSTVIYTTLFGKFDDLPEPQVVDKDFHYVLFTDDQSLSSSVWEIRLVEDTKKYRNIALAVRDFKIRPHLYFPEFQTSIWIDANNIIIGDFRSYMEQYQLSSDMLFFPHFERSCAYDEAMEVVRSGLATKKDILLQMQDYLNAGFPEENGLLYGGCIVRNHNEANVKMIMDAWWEEVNRHSQRDQISLPYVLWKLGGHYDMCDWNYRECPWFKYGFHTGIREL